MRVMLARWGVTVMVASMMLVGGHAAEAAVPGPVVQERRCEALGYTVSRVSVAVVDDAGARLGRLRTLSRPGSSSRWCTYFRLAPSLADTPHRVRLRATVLVPTSHGFVKRRIVLDEKVSRWAGSVSYTSLSRSPEVGKRVTVSVRVRVLAGEPRRWHRDGFFVGG